MATELGRTHLFTGFPWVLLGYSQTTVLPIAQLASLFGVYGVSALVAAVSAALAIGATAARLARSGSTRTASAGGVASRRRLRVVLAADHRRRGRGAAVRVGRAELDAHGRARSASG